MQDNMQPGTPASQQPTPQAQQPGITIRGRRFTLPWIIGGVVLALAVLTCGCCGSVTLAGALTSGNTTAQATATQSQSSAPQATHAPKPTATPKPQPTATPKPQLKVVLHLSGNGGKSSQTFTVHGSWQIAWTCSGVPSGIGGSAPLYIDVYNASDNSLNWDDEVSYNCPEGAKGGTDSSIFHDSGTFYLKVNTGISWDITVTDLPD